MRMRAPIWACIFESVIKFGSNLESELFFFLCLSHCTFFRDLFTAILRGVLLVYPVSLWLSDEVQLPLVFADEEGVLRCSVILSECCSLFSSGEGGTQRLTASRKLTLLWQRELFTWKPFSKKVLIESYWWVHTYSMAVVTSVSMNAGV